MMTISQAAQEFAMSERTVRRLVKEKQIPVTMVGNRAYISEAWLRDKLYTDGKLDAKEGVF